MNEEKYYIINRTTGSTAAHKGSWPGSALDTLIGLGNDIIVVSTYSNTIKIPTDQFETTEGDMSYNWKEYKLPAELTKNLTN